MNWVVFGVLLGFAIFNLLGVGIWHYEYRKDNETYEKYANRNALKDKSFWGWTVMLLLFGTAYVVLRFIIFLKGLLHHE